MRLAAWLMLSLLLLAGGHPARADLAGHGGPVRSLAVSQDGRTALSGGFDYSVMLWDIASGTAVDRLIGHDAQVTGVALTAQADRAVSVGDDGRVIAWDLARRAELWRVDAGAKQAAVALSPDGSTVATGGWDSGVRLLALADGRETARLGLDPGERVTAVAFTAEGGIVAGGHLGTVRLWRAAREAAPVRSWRAHGLGVTGIAAGDGVIATASPDRGVRLWDARTAEARGGELAGHVAPVTALALSPDGTWLASGAAGGELVLWRLVERQALLVRPAHQGPVWALAFRSGGGAEELLSAGGDGLIRRWSVPGGEPLGDEATPVQADAEGSTLFRKCVACHTLTVDGGNRAGPSLHGLFGRRAGSLPGYAYSRALRESGIVWTEETVARLFELGPDAYTPGSKMPLQRMPSAADRAALIAYLKRVTAAEQGERP